MAIPKILYDRMQTVWQEIDELGEVVWNPVFLDFHEIRDSHRGRLRRVLPKCYLVVAWLPLREAAIRGVRWPYLMTVHDLGLGAGRTGKGGWRGASGQTVRSRHLARLADTPAVAVKQRATAAL